jgi:hypothetical protein
VSSKLGFKISIQVFSKTKKSILLTGGIFHIYITILVPQSLRLQMLALFFFKTVSHCNAHTGLETLYKGLLSLSTE